MHLGCRTGLDLFVCFAGFIFVLFFTVEKPVYSNFLQLHNEVPFSDVQYPKVRESLAAVKQWLMHLHEHKNFLSPPRAPAQVQAGAVCRELELWNIPPTAVPLEKLPSLVT